LLYRFTGDQKYLDFCRYVLASWETPDGPKIISTLLTAKRVDKVGNAKAYEMLSCLNGALEFYRTTGDKQLLEAALNAWQDIVAKRLYLTGTASHHEHFHDDYELPNGNADVGETCVTVTWIQFNAQLLRLTGEARFADELERAVYNQLLGAQKPDGSGWGYYVQLEGIKPYSAELSGHCCLSSGPRGLALVPTFAVTTDAEGLVINFLAAGRTKLKLPDSKVANVEIASDYPADGEVRVKLRLDRSSEFNLKLRVPAWSSTATVAINGRPEQQPLPAGQYAGWKRKWHDGDTITVKIPLPIRTIVGEHGNRGKVAFARGPLILAADNALNPTAPIGSFTIPTTELNMVAGGRTNAVNATRTTNSLSHVSGETFILELAPFAEAGATLAPYQVWLPLAESKSGGAESP